MNSCWARSISPCSEGKSKEHYISKCLLPDVVTIKGFEWCKDEYKEIGVNSLTMTSLCKGHNEELSELDQAALDMWLMMQEVIRVINVRRAIKRKDWIHTKFTVDGTKFEKWCFKTFCNMMSLNKQWRLPDDVPLFVFGKKPLPEHCGLSFLYTIGDKIGLDNHIKFSELKHPANGTVGFIVDFKGLKVAGSWFIPSNEKSYIPAGFFPDGVSRKLLFHVTNLDSPDVGVRHRFDWSGHYNNNSSKLILSLRDQWSRQNR